MPPKPLVNTEKFDPDKIIASIEDIRKVNPHRYEFEMLSGILHIDVENKEIVAFKDLREDDFWTRGHIPGRPILPGVLMVEAAAQMCSYFIKTAYHFDVFIGFVGIENTKFRGVVSPPGRLTLMGKLTEVRKRRHVMNVQGYVDGRMVFESQVIGMPV